MEFIQWLINFLIIAVVTLCMTTCFALWRIRHQAGRLGAHLFAVLLALALSFSLHLLGRFLMTAQLPLSVEVLRIMGISGVLTTLGALCFYLLGLKNGDK